MENTKKIAGALISVYYKDGLEPIVRKLHEENVSIYSTGGTQTFIEGLGIPVIPVESMTSYPEIFGGRVKTLQLFHQPCKLTGGDFILAFRMISRCLR